MSPVNGELHVMPAAAPFKVGVAPPLVDVNCAFLYGPIYGLHVHQCQNGSQTSVKTNLAAPARGSMNYFEWCNPSTSTSKINQNSRNSLQWQWKGQLRKGSLHCGLLDVCRPLTERVQDLHSYETTYVTGPGPVWFLSTHMGANSSCPTPFKILQILSQISTTWRSPMVWCWKRRE